MNKQLTTEVQKELREFLTALGKKHGFRLVKNTARYDDTTCTIRLEVVDEGAPSRKVAAEQAGVPLALTLFGYQEVGSAHPQLGKSPRLVGYSARRPKFPFTVQIAGGKKVIINKALADKVFAAHRSPNATATAKV